MCAPRVYNSCQYLMCGHQTFCSLMGLIHFLLWPQFGGKQQPSIEATHAQNCKLISDQKYHIHITTWTELYLQGHCEDFPMVLKNRTIRVQTSSTTQAANNVHTDAPKRASPILWYREFACYSTCCVLRLRFVPVLDALLLKILQYHGIYIASPLTHWNWEMCDSNANLWTQKT